MPVSLEPAAKKSTTVRSKFCPSHLAGYCRGAQGRAPAATARDGPQDHASKLTVVPARPHQADSRPTRFERLVVPAFVAIVVCYAAAVIVRVIVAYGT